MDFSINVFAPKEIRSARCSAITGKPLSIISELMKCEMDDLQKNKLSTYIIHNYEGAEEILGEIREQISKLDKKIVDKYLIKEHTSMP
jgi:dephospho-CoA kinase